jgi:hypothetical protein
MTSSRACGGIGSDVMLNRYDLLPWRISGRRGGPQSAPIVLDLALFSDFAHRAGLKGIQEWLSFYYKSPMTAPGLQPEHDLFIQQTKLKNTLRHLMGEEQITHLGLEYYQS